MPVIISGPLKVNRELTNRDRKATLRWGGGTLVTQYWGGGAQDTFSHQLFQNFKNIGGGGDVPPPPPPLLRGP